jgi:formylglycine-generating enzyme required for sulfatase activity
VFWKNDQHCLRKQPLEFNNDRINMQKVRVQNRIAILLACFCCAVFPNQATAQDLKVKAAELTTPAKERLVLMPMRVSEENKNMQSAMENALVQGMQQKYVVFEGEQVAQKAKEIFLKESRDMSKKECNEIRCLQNIAEAFQAELIATSYVTKIEGGYLLSLNIQNIFDNKAVYTNTLPCRNCDGFQIVEKLKVLDNEPNPATLQSNSAASIAVPNTNVNYSDTGLWEEAQKGNKIADYKGYLTQYPRGKFATIAEGRINILEEQATTARSQQDQNAWSNATNTATAAGYQEYLNQYPQGLYTVQAKARIKKLQDGNQKIASVLKAGGIFRDCPECPEMVIIPAGEFNMGSNNGDKDEQPVHHVTIAKIFAMSKTEVTQGQWRALMSTITVQNNGENGLGELVGKLKHILPKHKKDVTEDHFSGIMETSPDSYKNCGDNCTAEQKRAIRESAERSNEDTNQAQAKVYIDNNPSYFKNCGDDCPVEQVSWTDAQKYIQKLIAKTGKQYRLPSEAEWEYACKGGAQTEYCGSDNVGNVAWYGGYSNPPGNSGKSTHPAGTLSANGFGLFDMSGNVWEWVEDNYHANYNGAPSDGSNWQGDASRHTLRGGSWGSKPQEVRSAQRGRSDPSSRGSIGFRVVRVLP